MSQLTIFHKFMDTIIGQSIIPVKTDAPILDKPYRAQVHYEPDGKKVRVSLPCARYGVWWLPLAFVFFGFPLFLWPTIPLVFYYPMPFLVTLAVLLIILYVMVRICFPRIAIEATKDGVTVGKYKFYWKYADGLRLGYTAGGKQRALEQGPYTGMRMGYGSWGFDLPYLVRGYYAPAYVVWVNMMLQTVQQVPQEQRINSPEEGFKKDLF